MKRTLPIPMAPRVAPVVALLACGTLMLGGCGALENFGGAKKVSPDEFKIVSHSPLTMPPNAELRPPRPGEARPQEVTPADQAKEALSPALAGRTQQRINAGPNAPRTGSSAEQSLVARAGQGGLDPEIRSRVNQDTRTLSDSDKSFIDSLIFWQTSPPPGVLVDPTREQQRIRDAQASGQPPTGPTPTITRRQRGILEGIF